MVIITSIVGESFYEELIDLYQDPINSLNYVVRELNTNNNVDLHVITDRSEDKIRGLFDGIDIHIHVYPYHIWDYTDKIYYTFKLNHELDREILWIDINKVSTYESILLQHNFSMDSFIRIRGEWEDRDDNVHHMLHPYFRPLMGGILDQHAGWEFRGTTLTHIDSDKYVNPLTIPLIYEHILFLPKGISNETILTDIFSLKGIFSHMSAVSNFPYKQPMNRLVVGNGEGILLGCILIKNNLPYKSF